MVLGRHIEVFSQQWVNRLRHIPTLAYEATVEFFEPNTEGAEWDFETETWTNTETILYTGPARVQPLRSAVDIANNANDATIQSVYMSVAQLDLDLRPKHRARVLTCDNNPTLTRYLYVLSEGVDSSNHIERSFLFKVNSEVEVTPDGG